ncbi:hypothetical protein NDU88_006590 [Pleurodeles waltl]|uniref:Uncharacterized protein n=1 Tax=Pleurodeles waltl TaxID=8319 RepID=A0AAV7WDY5_PLEWA|nr:hypothetical protein NDU88_006590 [Pleurodeles waltl]
MSCAKCVFARSRAPFGPVSWSSELWVRPLRLLGWTFIEGTGRNQRPPRVHLLVFVQLQHKTSLNTNFTRPLLRASCSHEGQSPDEKTLFISRLLVHSAPRMDEKEAPKLSTMFPFSLLCPVPGPCLLQMSALPPLAGTSGYSSR